MPDIRIGFIGLGQIGLPVARRILAAGYPLTGFRRSGSPELEAAGGKVAASVAETVEQSDIVIQCLPSEEALQDAGFGGVVPAARPGLTVVELSTYPAEVKERYRQALAARGAELVEVEVSGPPQMVIAGTAALFLGGTDEQAARVTPVLAPAAAAVLHVGPFGSALGMKLVANHLVAVNTAAAAEAMALGAALKLDPDKVVEVIGKSAGASAMFALRAPMMAKGEVPKGGGPVGTLAKYLDYIGAAATEAGLDLGLFDASDALYRRAIAEGLGEYDIAVVHRLMKPA